MRARIASWFSTMPLCTMPISSPPRAEKCGCAFASVGAPCVAQRVCESPVLAVIPLLAGELLELRDAPGRAQPLEVPVLDERDAGRVVAAVLELADALDQEVHHVARGGRADDAAHRLQ